jgi:uncharacterized protein (UPF0332 family)
MKGTMNDLINYRISRATETLKEAEKMMENEFWNASINRIYYACFYAVSALLLKKGVDTSSHKGIRQMFSLHYVQSGLISRDLAKFFSVYMIGGKPAITMILFIMIKKLQIICYH